MLRSILCRSRRVVAVTRATKSRTQAPSLSRFSHSSENASLRNIRLFSGRPGENNRPTGEKFDEAKLESLLSLLRGGDEESLELESGLKSLDVDLQLDLVVRVLESPGISGKNLIRFLNWAAKKQEITVTTSLVESRRRLEDAQVLWDLVKENQNNSALNLEILNEVIALCGKLGKTKSAFDVFARITEEFGFTPNGKTYYVTLEALCKQSSMEWASLVCEKMLKSGVLPEGDHIGDIVTWFCKQGKAKEAYSVYELAKYFDKCPLSTSVVSTLISALCKNDGTVSFAQEMLGDLTGEARLHGLEPFSDVIRSLCRMKNVKDAKAVLLDMISRGPAPVNAVFNLIIYACSKSGDLDEAKELLNLMESRGLIPDLYTYTLIISGYAKGGLMNEAREILAVAKKKHQKLSPVTYHALIRGYCNIGEYDEALTLLSDMDCLGVNPNDDEYSKLIESFCLKELDWESAKMLSEDMKQKGLHLTAIIQGLLKEMVSGDNKSSNYWKDVLMSPGMLSSIIVALLALAWDEVNKVRDKIQKDGEKKQKAKAKKKKEEEAAMQKAKMEEQAEKKQEEKQKKKQEKEDQKNSWSKWALDGGSIALVACVGSFIGSCLFHALMKSQGGL